MKRKSPRHGGPENKLSNFKPPHQSCACVPNPKIFANKYKCDALQNEASKGLVTIGTVLLEFSLVSCEGPQNGTILVTLELQM